MKYVLLVMILMLNVGCVTNYNANRIVDRDINFIKTSLATNHDGSVQIKSFIDVLNVRNSFQKFKYSWEKDKLSTSAAILTDIALTSGTYLYFKNNDPFTSKSSKNVNYDYSVNITGNENTVNYNPPPPTTEEATVE